MKKNAIRNLWVAGLALGFAACGNSNENSSATTDGSGSTSETTSTTTTTETSTSSYSARADSFRINSEAGNYLDARTGKPIRISVDTATGARTNVETNEPVDYYIDKRTWWVYDNQNWDSVGTARMEKDKVEFRGENDKWLPYEQKWKSDGKDSKLKSGDTKMKIDEDGDIKVKSGDEKMKMDNEGAKLKTKDGKVKSDDDGIKTK